jgi:hypothetical protein
MSDAPNCMYCGSNDTEDCGPITDDTRHIECGRCLCGFPWVEQNPVETNDA